MTIKTEQCSLAFALAANNLKFKYKRLSFLGKVKIIIHSIGQMHCLYCHLLFAATDASDCLLHVYSPPMLIQHDFDRGGMQPGAKLHFLTSPIATNGHAIFLANEIKVEISGWEF